MRIKTTVEAEYDTKTDSFFLFLPSGSPAVAVVAMDKYTIAEVDKENQIVSLEVLAYSKRKTK